MALVTHIESTHKERQSVHQPTRCLSSIVVAADGKRYLQLDTYGSDDRAHPEKISQSIQFDDVAAAELIDLFKQAFPVFGN